MKSLPQYIIGESRDDNPSGTTLILAPEIKFDHRGRYFPQNRKELEDIIRYIIAVSKREPRRGQANGLGYINLNTINVSKITDMKRLFRHAQISVVDISEWDVSNVTDMKDMFRH